MPRPEPRPELHAPGRAGRASAAGVAGLTAAAAALQLARQGADEAVALATGGPHGAQALDAGIGVVGLALLAALLGWLAVGLLACGVQALPGACGTVADGVVDRVLPTVVRATVRSALGLGVLSGSALPAVADVPATAPVGQLPGDPAPADSTIAAPGRPGRAAERVDLPPVTRPAASRPLVALPAARGVIHAPLDTAATAALHGAARGHRTVQRAADPASHSTPGLTVGRDHVVRRGDTLWSIAAGRLEAGAGDHAIAASWPQWYRANRDVIGADPDVLRPGTRLQAPT